MTAEAPWNEEWSDPDYQWPVTSVPDAAVVDRLGKQVVASDGRALKEAHADRGMTMDFPNGAVPGTRIRKQVPRTECRRQSQIMVPVPPDFDPAPDTPPRENAAPVKVCIGCDAAYLWPRFA